MSANQHILYGGVIRLKDKIRSLGELFQKRLRELGDSTLLINALTQDKLTAFQLYTRSTKLAECLRYAGVKPGHQIATCCENSFEYVYVLLASIYVGATLTPMNVDYTDDELIAAITLSRPRFIFCTRFKIGRISKLCENYSFVEKIIDFEGCFRGPKVISLNDFSAKAKFAKSMDVSLESLDMSKNVAIILRTSGTTSCPKSIQMTQLNILCTVLEHSDRELTPVPLIFSALPWPRAFGFRLLLRQIYHNLKTVFLPQFNEHDFLRSIEIFRPNTINLYTTTMEFLARSPCIENYNLQSIKVLFTSSAPLKKQIKDLVHKRLGIPMIIQGYGMTELSSIADQTDCCQKEGSVGVLRRGILAKVVDINTGSNLGAFEKGELMFTGPNLMLGYLGNEEANQKSLTADGWFHTGDYGYFDNDHEWFLVDRIKDLIQCGKRIISPAEIENILLEHPKIRDAAIIGISNDCLGEIPIVFVECSNEAITSEEIISFLEDKTNLRCFAGVRFLDRIPRDPAGKSSKVILRKMLHYV